MTYLLVKLDPDALESAGRTFSAHPIVAWTWLGVPGWARVTLSAQQLAATRAALAHDPGVLAVSEDHRVRATFIPNDTYWGWQWGPALIDAPAAWNRTTGRADVVIAVLDTGIDLAHSDLAGQMWINPGEIPNNGLDDDGNDKVDDINGWRFNRDAGGGPDESNDVSDGYGHGTHVAGTIAAHGDNGLGVAGMAWGCRLMVLKVLDDSGDGWYSDVAAGLAYAVDNGARIANLSLGGPDDDSLMQDAIDYAHARGVLVVAASGNVYQGDYSVLYPAAYEHAVAVAATNSSDRRSSFSCYGPEVDLSAPGSSVYSTCLGSSYCYRSGTSMATPHVSGLAALIWSYHSTYTATQVTQLMFDTARDIEQPGWDPYTGWGRINARGALGATLPYHYYFPFVPHATAFP
jgi:subtilisin family serine protease